MVHEQHNQAQKQLSEEEQLQLILTAKAHVEKASEIASKLPFSPNRSVALRKLEGADFWLNWMHIEIVAPETLIVKRTGEANPMDMDLPKH